MTEAITTIQFNTGRKYTAEGQIIIATLFADGSVTFMDHSRLIDGEFKSDITGKAIGNDMDAETLERILRATVERRYDAGQYQATRRSSLQGMVQGGRNTREAFELRAKLKALPTPEKTAANGYGALTSLWADFCGSFDLPRDEAAEVLALVSGNFGDAWGDVSRWIMDFIMEWEKLADAPEEPKESFIALGNGKIHLFDSESQSEVRGWIKGYIKGGDFGGYHTITLEDNAGNVLETFEAPEPEPEEDDGVTAMYPDHLDADEREIIDAMICEALARGFEVRVQGLTPYTTDYQLITQNVAATDEERLMFRRVGDDMGAGWVFLVHGNAASEVIADATDNLLMGGLLDAVKPIIDRLEAEGK